MTKKTFYVTTAIDYVNAEPHIGHAYQKIVADVLARWHRLLGEDVFFLTGTDEHGKKVAQSAEKLGKTPKEFVDEISAKFKEAWQLLNIQPSRFIRTTDKDHKEIVKDFVLKANKSKDIYKGKYSGLYCIGCERYYTEKELTNNECPYHPGKALEHMEEETYFFKLSKYQKFLLGLYKKHPEFILPEEVRKDVINRVKEGLKDFSITRTSFNWGIPFPLDKKHVVYVWFDALINYYTAVSSSKNKKFWPANVHLLGTDNTWFHCVYWPAMLKSVGIKMPITVFNHGFFTFNGQKISKSLGNAISPKTMAEKYGADTIRYYALRAVPFGEDGDFSESALIDRHNNELANKLGNLVSRVSTLAEKYGLEKTRSLDSSKILKKIKIHFEKYEFDKALNEIFAFIDFCNEYIQSKKPWETQDKKVLWQLANAIKDISIFLSPFMPATAEKIAKTFSFELSLKSLSKPLKISKIKKADILFKKIETEEKPSPIEENKNTSNIIENKNINKSQGIEGIMNIVNYQDWEKVDLRVAKIEKVEDIEGADKLYKLTINIGSETRTICAGLKKHYKKEELKGKKIIVFTNLAPRMMRGIESQGMLLAAVSEDESQVTLISPEKDIKEGSKIR